MCLLICWLCSGCCFAVGLHRCVFVVVVCVPRVSAFVYVLLLLFYSV